jgi:hypothetical protein
MKCFWNFDWAPCLLALFALLLWGWRKCIPLESGNSHCSVGEIISHVLWLKWNINTLCELTAEFWKLKLGGTCIHNHYLHVVHLFHHKHSLHQFPTAAARVRSQVMCGLWWTKCHCGQIFSDYFGFLCQFLFHHMLQTDLSSRAGTIGKLVADVLSGPCFTPS